MTPKGEHGMPASRRIQSRGAFLTQAVVSVATPGFIGAACGGAAAQPLSSLSVATIGGDIGAQAWYAQDLGIFRKYGLDVTVNQMSGNQLDTAVTAGAVDVAFSGPIQVAIARSKGLPLSILAPANMYVANAPTAGLMAVRQSSAINSAKDLNGKVVAVSSIGAIPYFGARAWIDRGGGDSKSVHFVELTFSEMADAVRAGRVDAAVMDITADPSLGKTGDSLRLLGQSFDAIAPQFVSGTWISRTGWIVAHEPEAKTFLQAMLETATWANAHHGESAEILAKHSQIPLALLETVTRVTYATEISPRLVQPLIDVSTRYGAMPPGVSARALMIT
jgi:NitT/TauT family transport system substrate-binding protein